MAAGGAGEGRSSFGLILWTTRLSPIGCVRSFVCSRAEDVNFHPIASFFFFLLHASLSGLKNRTLQNRQVRFKLANVIPYLRRRLSPTVKKKERRPPSLLLPRATLALLSRRRTEHDFISAASLNATTTARPCLRWEGRPVGTAERKRRWRCRQT